jgi:hypothetical protein
MKVTVAFIRIFLPDGYDVSTASSDAKARTLAAGREAEINIQALIAAENIKANAYGTVVKALKQIHAVGKLNDRILQYQKPLQEGDVLDPSPPKTIHTLLPCDIEDAPAR